MLVEKFYLPGERESSITLPHSRIKGNRLTILLGVNGTQKSTLLRSLLDEALSLISNGDSMGAKDGVVTFTSAPSSVIALSAIPNDRFPTKTRIGYKQTSKYSVPEYEYIGPRHNQNIVSRNQSLQALTSAALSSELKTEEVRAFVQKISLKTGIPTRFKILLGRGPVHTKYRQAQVSEFFSSELMDRGRAEDLYYLESNQLVSEFTDFLEDIKLRSFEFDVDLLGGESTSKYNPKFIDIAIRAKFLSVRKSSFEVAGQYLNPESFSAGQWGLFSSLITLAFRVGDNSLILIDEPESALHPSWQREYIDSLGEVLRSRSGCHIFLATHSPLIVSSTGNFKSDLVILKRNVLDKTLYATLEKMPEGWQSNDILEDKFELSSTRAPSLVLKLDRMLKLVAEGLAGNKTAIRKIVKDITPVVHSLPDNDQVRVIVSSISKLLEGK